jgi:SET domain-containing protein
MSRKRFRVGRSRTGLGLFATAPIAKGDVIVEYKGRRIGNKEADEIDARGGKYMYELNSRWTLDGSTRRNVARYANHSCRPNAESDVVKGKVLISARKSIEPGEEITYNYGRNYFDLVIKPIGCKCDKCIEKRRQERAELRAKARRRAARKARAAKHPT